MKKTTIGIAGWPVVAQISILMGYIMCGVDYILNHFNCTNIIFYILFFIIINKIILLPFSIKSGYISHLGIIAKKEFKHIDDKYKNIKTKEHNLKSQIEKQAVKIKYGIVQSGCLLSIVKILIVIALYSVLKNLEIYVPRIGALSPDAISEIYMLGDIYLKDKVSFKEPITLLFPLFAALMDLLSNLIKNNKKSSSSNSGISKFYIFTSPLTAFYICYQFPLFISIYWGIQNITSTLLNMVIAKCFKIKNDKYYIEKKLNKFNKYRQKRGLQPLSEIPTNIRKEETV